MSLIVMKILVSAFIVIAFFGLYAINFVQAPLITIITYMLSFSVVHLLLAILGLLTEEYKLRVRK